MPDARCNPWRSVFPIFRPSWHIASLKWIHRCPTLWPAHKQFDPIRIQGSGLFLAPVLWFADQTVQSIILSIMPAGTLAVFRSRRRKFPHHTGQQQFALSGSASTGLTACSAGNRWSRPKNTFRQWCAAIPFFYVIGINHARFPISGLWRWPRSTSCLFYAVLLRGKLPTHATAHHTLLRPDLREPVQVREQ